MTEVRLCFLGESFVNGTGDPACLGWSGRICRAAWQRGHEVTYYNLGIRRETTAELRARWLREARLRLPKDCDGRLVFSFGVNDTTLMDGAPRVAVADSVDNARAILSEARERHPVLMIGPPPVADGGHNARIAQLSARYAQIAGEIAVPFLDVCWPLIASSVWVDEVASGDGAHPGAGGYAALAGLVENWPAWKDWLD